MTKMTNMLKNGMIRTYVAYKTALTNRKGSPTVEYVIVVMAAALIGGLLIAAAKDNSIGTAIKTKIQNAINGAGQ